MVGVAQRGDGVLEVDLPADHADEILIQLRHVLATGVDHTPFLRRFEDDALIGRSIRRRRGMRPARLATVGHALVAAFAGQLVTTAEAEATQRGIIRAIDRAPGGPRRPPTLSEVGALAPAVPAAAGLTARRAASLIRVSRRLDVDRLRSLATPDAERRLCAERDVGPWSAAIVLGGGLGRFDLGPVGDLGLIRLCERLQGGPADVADTRALLGRYGEWQALAGAHLLSLPRAGARRRPPPRRRM